MFTLASLRSDEELGRLCRKQIDADSLHAHEVLGVIYTEQARFDEAISEFQETIRIDPDYAVGYYNVGYTYDLQGKRDEAITYYTKAIQLDPNDAKPHLNLGIVYRDVEKYTEAIAEFEAFLRLQPDSPNRAAVEKEIARLKRMGVELALEYRNPVSGYSVRYPQGWFTSASGVNVKISTSQAALAAKVETALKDSPLVVVLVGSPEQLAKSFGVGQAATPEELLGTLGKSYAESSEVKSIRVSDELAAIADISGTLAGTPVKGSHMLVFSGDNSLYILALCPPDQWETLSPTLKAMLASLAYLEP